MRTKEELKSKEFNDDMTELKELLEKEGIEHIFKRHRGADPKLLGLIGYYPTGEWHIIVGNLSIIKGMVSFGDYELMGIEDDPVRFEKASEVLEEIKKRINQNSL